MATNKQQKSQNAPFMQQGLINAGHILVFHGKIMARHLFSIHGCTIHQVAKKDEKQPLIFLNWVSIDPQSSECQKFLTS